MLAWGWCWALQLYTTSAEDCWGSILRMLSFLLPQVKTESVGYTFKWKVKGFFYSVAKPTLAGYSAAGYKYKILLQIHDWNLVRVTFGGNFVLIVTQSSTLFQTNLLAKERSLHNLFPSFCSLREKYSKLDFRLGFTTICHMNR